MKQLFPTIACIAMTAAVFATSCKDNKGNDGEPQPVEYAISFTAAENGSAKAFLGTTEVDKAKEGDVITVKAEANNDYEFIGWSSTPDIEFTSATTAETTFTMPASEVSITAAFAQSAPTGYALNYTLISTGGTVMATVGAAPVAPGDIVEIGTEVTITATPDAGYKFDGWSGVELGANATELSATFRMPEEEVTIAAAFSKKLNALNFAAAPTGGTVTVTVGTEAIATGADVEVGATVEIKATPATGYEFVEWGGVELGDNKTVAETSFTMPDAVVTITATFAKQEAINVGGVRWALFNVDAPNTFAESPEAPGLLYQWGQAVGWTISSGAPVSNPAGSPIVGAGFVGQVTPWPVDTANPCPEGYTVPTNDQWTALVNAATSIEDKTVGTTNGRVIKLENGELFFPYRGYSTSTSTTSNNLTNATTHAWFWTANGMSSSMPPAVAGIRKAENATPFLYGNQMRNTFASVRCVGE